MSEATESEQPIPTEERQHEPTDTNEADKYFNWFRQFFFVLGVLGILALLTLIFVISARPAAEIPAAVVFLFIIGPIIILINFALWFGLKRESSIVWKVAMAYLGLGVLMSTVSTNPVAIGIDVMGLYMGWKAKDATVL